MAESTGISWCDATFNPWVGCTKISRGCTFCYAEELVTGRMGRAGTWGPRGTRERTSAGNWKKPLAWERQVADGRANDTGIGRAILRGDRPRVFCASLADVFEERPELDPWRSDLFDLIEQTPSLDWLVLTKRPDVARDWLRAWYEEDLAPPAATSPLFRSEGDENWAWRDGIRWAVLSNLWIGTSIEGAAYTWRADALREIPAAVRFISAEPLLGSLLGRDSQGHSSEPVACTRESDALAGERATPSVESLPGRAPLDLSGVDWVIVGGESGGRDARPMHPDWARELRDACLAPIDAALDAIRAPDYDGRIVGCQRPAFHMKQWGSHAPVTKTEPRAGDVWVYPDGHTETWQEGDGLGLDGDIPERDEYGIIVHPDGSGAALVRYAGSLAHAGGKYLDRVDWCEVPPSPLAVAA